jgi:hypothetical protein
MTHRHLFLATVMTLLVVTSAQASERRAKPEPSFFDIFQSPTSPSQPDAAQRPRHRAKAQRQAVAPARTGQAVAPVATSRVLVLSPQAATRADVTHSALVLTRKRYSGSVAFAGRLQTVKQLRTGSAPNPWECGWVVWNYRDSEHFYYLAVKPNGWEIGKRDPAYPGGQRFLASGHTAYPIGSWHRFAVTQDGARMTVHLNGTKIAAYTDAERPYTDGALGFYVEDAEIQIDRITAPFAENFAAYPAKTMIRTDGAVMRNWVTPFLGYGFLAIDDRKR